MMLLLPNNLGFCDELQRHTKEQQNAIFDRLESRVDEFPLENSDAVTVTLLNAGEVVDGTDLSMFSFPGAVRVFRLLLFFLQRHEDLRVRSELLISAFERTKGFVVIERLLMSEASARSDSEATDLDEEGYENLRQTFVESLLTYASQDPDAFIAHWNFVSYIYRLNRFAEGAGREWTEKHVTSVVRFIRFAEAVVSKSTGYSENSVSEHYFVRISSLEDLFGIEACKGWIDRVDRASLSGKPLQAIDLVAQALGRHERGEKSDYD